MLVDDACVCPVHLLYSIYRHTIGRTTFRRDITQQRRYWGGYNHLRVEVWTVLKDLSIVLLRTTVSNPERDYSTKSDGRGRVLPWGGIRYRLLDIQFASP